MEQLNILSCQHIVDAITGEAVHDSFLAGTLQYGWGRISNMHVAKAACMPLQLGGTQHTCTRCSS